MTKQTIRSLSAAALFLLTIPIPAQSQPDSNFEDYSFTQEEIAAAKNDPEAFTINPESVRIVLKSCSVPEDQESQENICPVQSKNPVVVITEIVNIALKVWDIIKKDAPTIDLETKFATAVPKGIEAWNQLVGWKKPVGYVYNVSATNSFGSRCIDIDFKVIYTYGGQYEGKGKYLTGVTVIHTKIDVSWGYHVGLAAEVPDSTIINMGTTEDPVAAMQLVLKTRMATAVHQTIFTNVFQIDGNGGMEEIAGPYAKRAGDLKSAAPLLMDNQVFN